jgi:hypothetical protein
MDHQENSQSFFYNLKSQFEKNFKSVFVILLCSVAVSYGLSDLMDMSKLFSLIGVVGFSVFYFTKSKQSDDSGIPPGLEQMIEESDQILKNQEEVIKNQREVIEDYEKIFDGQLTELDCICGGNTFQGIFQPGVENIVECQKCSNKYKVMVSFDSILISNSDDF